MARNSADDILEDLSSFVVNPTNWMTDTFPNENPTLIPSVSEHTACIHGIIKKVVELKRHGRGLQSDVDAAVSYSWNLSDALKPARGLFRFDDRENTAKILEVLARDSKFSKLGLRSDIGGGGSRGGQGGGEEAPAGEQGERAEAQAQAQVLLHVWGLWAYAPKLPGEGRQEQQPQEGQELNVLYFFK